MSPAEEAASSADENDQASGQLKPFSRRNERNRSLSCNTDTASYEPWNGSPIFSAAYAADTTPGSAANDMMPSARMSRATAKTASLSTMLALRYESE